MLRVVPGSPAAQAGAAAGRGGGRGGRQAGEAHRRPAGGGGRASKARRHAGPARAEGPPARARVELTLGADAAGDPAQRPDPALQQGHDGPAPAGRGLPGHRGRGLRPAQPGPVRHALRRLRGRPRAPAEGPGRAAPAARALAGHRRSTTSGWPWSGSATSRRRSRPTAAAAGAKDATLFNNDGPSVAAAWPRAGGGAVTAPSARLVWERPDGTRVEFALTAPVMTVGRDETADIRVDEPLVSRAHARIERRGATASWSLDLGSTNFTRVNGELVSERTLAHGDEAALRPGALPVPAGHARPGGGRRVRLPPTTAAGDVDSPATSWWRWPAAPGAARGRLARAGPATPPTRPGWRRGRWASRQLQERATLRCAVGRGVCRADRRRPDAPRRIRHRPWGEPEPNWKRRKCAPPPSWRWRPRWWWRCPACG